MKRAIALIDGEHYPNVVREALDEVSRYRQEALPQMAGQILELDQLTREAEQAVDRHERGKAKAGTLDVESHRETGD